jgi:hypothetical protein
MKKDIYKIAQPKRKIAKVDLKPEIKRVEQEVILKLQLPEIQKTEVTNQPEPQEVIFPEVQKVEITNPAEPVVIPEKTTIKNTDEIAEKIGSYFPQPVAPIVNIPKTISINNFPKVERVPFPKELRVNNLLDLFNEGDIPNKADPTKYIPVRLTNGKKFYMALEEAYVSAAKAVFPFVNATTGKPQAASVNNDGTLRTDIEIDSTNLTVSGTGGGVYNSTPPTLTNGQQYTEQLDVNGNLKDTMATLLAGEDLVNNVIKVEQRFSYAVIQTAATTIVKSGAGFLHAFNVIGGTLGQITVYDNTAGSGTMIIPTTTISGIGQLPAIYDIAFNTGLTIVTATAIDITISYR